MDPFSPQSPDTVLARLLHARGRVPLNVLQQALTEVRTVRGPDPNQTLAGSLVRRGLLSEQEAVALLNEVGAGDTLSAGQGGRSTSRRMQLESSLVESTSGMSQAAGWREGGVVGDFFLLDKLGQGGMGIVYRARHLQTGEEVALKGLQLEADEDLHRRFEREAEAQTRAGNHPNVVRVLATGQGGGYSYMAMELATGGDLQERLRKGPLGPEASARLVAQLARGMGFCHRFEITHRDLKPGNVIFNDQDVPKLVDFGLARLRTGRSSLTKTGEILGTPAFMAPEQAFGDATAVDQRCDVYALGAILYNCVSGRTPFTGATSLEVLSAVLTDEPPSLVSLVPTLDPRLSKICQRAMAKSPEDRYQTADELAAELEVWLQGGAEARTAGSLPLLAGLALVALACLGLVGWAATQQKGLGAASPAPSASPTQAEPAEVEPSPSAVPAHKPQRAWPPQFRPRLGQRFLLTMTYDVDAIIRAKMTGGFSVPPFATSNQTELRFAGVVSEVGPREVVFDLKITRARVAISSLHPHGEPMPPDALRVSDSSTPPAPQRNFSVRTPPEHVQSLQNAAVAAAVGITVKAWLNAETGEVLRVDANSLKDAIDNSRPLDLRQPKGDLPPDTAARWKAIAARWNLSRYFYEAVMLHRCLDQVFNQFPSEQHALLHPEANEWSLSDEKTHPIRRGLKLTSALIKTLSNGQRVPIALPGLSLREVLRGDRLAKAERTEQGALVRWGRTGSNGLRTDVSSEAEIRGGWVRAYHYNHKASPELGDSGGRIHITVDRKATLELID